MHSSDWAPCGIARCPSCLPLYLGCSHIFHKSLLRLRCQKDTVLLKMPILITVKEPQEERHLFSIFLVHYCYHYLHEKLAACNREVEAVVHSKILVENSTRIIPLTYLSQQRVDIEKYRCMHNAETSCHFTNLWDILYPSQLRVSPTLHTDSNKYLYLVCYHSK